MKTMSSINTGIKMKRWYLIIMLLSIMNIGFGQTNGQSNFQFGIDSGFGIYSSINETSGFSKSIGISLLEDNMIYKLRYINHEEFELFGPLPLEKLNNVGVLFGSCLNKKYFQLNVSGGIGIASGIIRGEFLYTDPSEGEWDIYNADHYARDFYMTASIPVETEMIFKPFKYLGVGFSLFAEINTVRPAYGGLVKLGIGKLR